MLPLSLDCTRTIICESPIKSSVGTPGGCLFLHSPISPTGQTPSEANNIHDRIQTTPAACPHAFHPPIEGDSRSPCPALNTLANHGYLPRDGKHITPDQLVAALEHPDTYHLSKPLAQFLAKGGFFMMHQCLSPSLDLHDLARHNLIEHDASLVHRDVAPGDEYAPIRCDTILLNELLDSDVLTLKKVANRRTELERTAPLDAVHQEVARGEWALVLDIFGREHGGNSPSNILRVWLNENRFPEGWKPGHKQGLMETVSEARDIRGEMKKCRKSEK